MFSDRIPKEAKFAASMKYALITFARFFAKITFYYFCLELLLKTACLEKIMDALKINTDMDALFCYYTVISGLYCIFLLSLVFNLVEYTYEVFFLLESMRAFYIAVNYIYFIRTNNYHLIINPLLVEWLINTMSMFYFMP
jgi:hypothetical protein